MYAVGRLISRSIYTVSGPFHPFGGAVDIVVVEQPDGSFKSSPWYVRFGKFQGVLKTREKVVSICVNGVEADFHMYLDHTGEAYFLEEMDEEIEVESSSSGNLADEQLSSHEPMQSLSCNFGAEESNLARSENANKTGSKGGLLRGLVWGRRLSQEEPTSDVSQTNSLDQAEIVANLMDSNWSTELAIEKTKPSSHLYKSLASSHECDVDGDCLPKTSVGSTSVAVSLVQEPSNLISALSQDFGGLQMGSSGDDEQRIESIHLLTGNESLIVGSAVKLLEMNPLQEHPSAAIEESVESRLVTQSNGIVLVNEVTSNRSHYDQQNSSGSFSPINNAKDCEGTDIVEEACNLKVDTDQPRVSAEDAGIINNHMISSSIDTIHRSEFYQTTRDDRHEDELFLFSDDEFNPAEGAASSSMDKEISTLTSIDDTDSHEALGKHVTTCHASSASLNNSYQEDVQKKFEELLEKQQQQTFFPIDIHAFHDANSEFDERMVESLPNMWSHIDSLEADHQPRRSFDATTTSPRRLNLRNSFSSCRKPGEGSEADTGKSQLTATAEPLSGTLKSDFVSSGVGDPSKTIVVPSGTWRLWPFSFQRATSSKSTTPSVNPSSEVTTSPNVNHPTEIISPYNDVKHEVKRKIVKKKMRTLTPTSAQLNSLGLKDGGNIITFTFSTAMLGKQQVDARIYLWKWNSRIVISDVDGTITRSDVLGQFMPMVGYDWSHIGVAHLFSAIKDNGYQLLFLSARSISQSHLTRQFLFNLKQDGKALPDGPVVISPDGLFPSLFREVIRRAPHEFKIACLEDIRALFPPDCNPFYAGFGNRNTDEISYLRVGIPEGKIFIINPKGEVAVHRRVDTNSYSDLHTLVNGMFPPTATSEQEAFNSWNFWKLPPSMDF